MPTTRSGAPNFGNSTPGTGSATLVAESDPVAQTERTTTTTHSDSFVRSGILDAALETRASSHDLGTRPSRQVHRLLQAMPSGGDLLLLAMDRVRSSAQQNRPRAVDREGHDVCVDGFAGKQVDEPSAGAPAAWQSANPLVDDWFDAIAGAAS